MITENSSSVINLSLSGEPRRETPKRCFWSAPRRLDWLRTKVPSLSGPQFRLLFILACYADNVDGGSWPSIKTLAQELRTAPSFVHKLIGELEALECIDIDYGKPGRGHPNGYTLRADPADIAEFNAQQASQSNGKAKPAPARDAGIVRLADATSREPRRSSTRGTYLRDDWSPDDESTKLAVDRLGHDGARHALSKFRDHYKRQTGMRALSADWNASFRLWCWNAPPRPKVIV